MVLYTNTQNSCIYFQIKKNKDISIQTHPRKETLGEWLMHTQVKTIFPHFHSSQFSDQKAIMPERVFLNLQERWTVLRTVSLRTWCCRRCVHRGRRVRMVSYAVAGVAVTAAAPHRSLCAGVCPSGVP